MEQNMTQKPIIEIKGLKKRYRMGVVSGKTFRADWQSFWAKKMGKPDPNVKLGMERLQGQIFALQGRVMALENADFARKAEEYAGKGSVVLFEGDMSADSVRKLCTAVLEKCGGRCAVFAGTDGAYKYAVGEEGGDLRALIKELNAALKGRGGGKPNFAQGSAECTEAEIRAFFTDK